MIYFYFVFQYKCFILYQQNNNNNDYYYRIHNICKLNRICVFVLSVGNNK